MHRFWGMPKDGFEIKYTYWKIIGTSETIYSKGHNVIIKDLDINVSTTMLCDNAGFHVSRGSKY